MTVDEPYSFEGCELTIIDCFRFSHPSTAIPCDTINLKDWAYHFI